jgi:hypothetical protein
MLEHFPERQKPTPNFLKIHSSINVSVVYGEEIVWVQNLFAPIL